MTRHQDRILDQFTKQADAYAAAPALRNAESLRLVVNLAEARSNDTVLDVACGPGFVACAFAEVCRRATGIDLTPAMIEKAQTLQREKALTNVSWRVGHVLPLPFADASFSIVVCRYALHHMEDPYGVVAEMARVSAYGGKVVLADVFASSDPEKAAAYNQMEKLRDPSHVRALPLAELERLPKEVGLRHVRTAFYQLEMEVEQVLRGSFPNPGDAEKVRQLFVEEVEKNNLDLRAHRRGTEIHFAYPIAIIVSEKS